MDDGAVIVEPIVVVVPLPEICVVVVLSPDASVLAERVGEDVVGKLGDVLSVVGSVDVFIGDGSMSVEKVGEGVVEVLVPEIDVVVLYISDESVLVDLVDGFVGVVLVLLGSVIIGVGFVVESGVTEVAVAMVFVSDTSMPGDLVDESVVGKLTDILSVVWSVDAFISGESASVE